MTGITAKSRIAELLARANAIRVTVVLADHFGVLVPLDLPPDQSWKTDCPFNTEHGDGGLDKNFRVYGSTNASYCFAMHGQMDPVRLFMMKHDLRPVQAAEKLLKAYGLASGRDWKERYAELILAREQRAQGIGSIPYLVEALNKSLSQHPAYSDQQFTPKFARALEIELDSLDSLLAHVSGDTDLAVREWYKDARNRLTTVLDQEEKSSA